MLGGSTLKGPHTLLARQDTPPHHTTPHRATSHHTTSRRRHLTVGSFVRSFVYSPRDAQVLFQAHHRATKLVREGIILTQGEGRHRTTAKESSEHKVTRWGVAGRVMGGRGQGGGLVEWWDGRLVAWWHGGLLG